MNQDIKHPRKTVRTIQIQIDTYYNEFLILFEHEHSAVAMRYLYHKHAKYRSLQASLPVVIGIWRSYNQCQSAQPHTDAEIIEFPIFLFLREILSNSFICMSICPLSSSKYAVIKIFRFEILRTKHRTPCQCVERVSVGTASSKKIVVYLRKWYTTMGYRLVK